MTKDDAIAAAKNISGARFVAKDDDGTWGAFSVMPYFENGEWHLPRNGGFGPLIGKSWVLGNGIPREQLVFEILQ